MQVTTFFVEDAPSDGVGPPQQWMAIATTHVFAPERTVKNLNRAGVLLSGEAMLVVDGKGFASTEDAAAVAAVRGLLFELNARTSAEDRGPAQ